MNSQKLFQLQKASSPETEHIFVIIGSGLSGISTFSQLIEKLCLGPKGNFRIKIFEKNAQYFATGEPYQVNTPAIWTLNNPASKMNLTPNGQDAASWIEENQDKWKEKFPNIDKDYVPRALIGMYMKAQYEKYKKKGKLQGIFIDECFDSITDIIPLDCNQWKIKTEQSRSYFANTLFLCVGHAPSGLYTHLEKCSNYFTSNSPIEELSHIPSNEDIYIIGGQASYVDLAILLAFQNGHKGRIHSLTRNQSIITSKGNSDECYQMPLEELSEKLNSYQPNSLSFISTKKLLSETYQKSVKNTINFENLPSTKDTLSYQIAKYDHKPNLNSTIGNIDETRSFFLKLYMNGCYQKIWETLCEEDKSEFNKQLFTTIMAFVTGITPLNARLLLELYNRKMLVEHSGVSKILYNENNKKFTIEFQNHNSIEANYLINACGYGYNISQSNIQTPLLCKLIERELIVAKKFGGIEITAHGQLITKNKEVLTSFFCIGPIASYNFKYPTPYASFIAVEAAKNAIEAIDISPTLVPHKHKINLMN